MKTLKCMNRRAASVLDDLDEAILSLRRSGEDDQDALSPSLRFRIERLEQERRFVRGRLSRQFCSAA
jgi:hypothetical protein